MKKGHDFETQVAVWLERKLGCSRTRLNELVRLDKQLGCYECDVHAERSRFNWERARMLGATCLIFGFGSAAMQRWDLARPSFVIGIIVAAFWLVGRRLSRSEHIWVECKDLRAPVNRDHINKLASTMKRSMTSRVAPWRANKALFFSSSGYNRDARQVAKAEGIECYQQDRGGGFIRVE